MADLNTSLGDPEGTVIAALADGVTADDPHPNLHIEDREMLEILRTTVLTLAASTVDSNEITDATALGRSLIKAVDAAAARTLLGAGTSNLALGSTASTAKAGNYQPTAANISDSTAVGRSVLTAASAAAARAAIDAAQEGSGGSSGTVVTSPTVTATVYSNHFRGASYANRPVTDADDLTWTCDGVGDNVEIQAAIDAVAAAGGGTVKLVGPLFMNAAAAKIRTAVAVRGEGRGTKVKPSANYSTDLGLFMLYDNTSHATGLHDLTIDCDGRHVYGVHYIADGGQTFSAPEPDTNPDPIHQISNLLILRPGSGTVPGYGMRMQGGNLRGGQYSDISIRKATGCGVWIDQSVDSHYTNIEVGMSGLNGPTYSASTSAPVGHAFFIRGEQNLIMGCKGWYSRGAGFFLNGVRNRLFGSEAQDNYSHGFHGFHGKNIYTGCVADSNGQANGADGRGRAGFWLGSDTNTVTGCTSFDKQESSTSGWWQQYGFQFTGGLTDSAVIGCTTYGNEVSSTTGTPHASTTVQVISVGGK